MYNVSNSFGTSSNDYQYFSLKKRRTRLAVFEYFDSLMSWGVPSWGKSLVYCAPAAPMKWITAFSTLIGRMAGLTSEQVDGRAAAEAMKRDMSRKCILIESSR